MRQTGTREEDFRMDTANEGTSCLDEIFLSERETPKYTTPLDLGLNLSDQAYHSQLIVTCKLKALKNHRVMSKTEGKRSDRKRNTRRTNVIQNEHEEDENV